MTVTHPCRDAWDNAFCVGTGCVISRSALDARGGCPRATIAEGPAGSFTVREVQQAGWAQTAPAGAIHGGTRGGTLFRLDPTTGAGTPVGQLPVGGTEIEYDSATGRAYVQHPDGSYALQPFDISTGAATGPAVGDGASFNGLEYAGSARCSTPSRTAGRPTGRPATTRPGPTTRAGACPSRRSPPAGSARSCSTSRA